MVRFIISKFSLFFLSNSKIYIPIWLDLLSKLLYPIAKAKRDLHSNMVRFIIMKNYEKSVFLNKFTFQYG